MPGLYDVGLSYSATRANPGRTLDGQSLRELIRTAGWHDDKSLGEAIQVVDCESSRKTDAISNNNPGGPDHRNIGLFQIWAGNVAYPEKLKDPVYNANVARRMYLADKASGGTGWGPWACKSSIDPNFQTPKNDDEAQSNVDDATRGVKSGIDAVGDFATLLSSGTTWERIGLVVLGGVLLTASVLILAGEFMTKVPTPIKAAIK